MTLLSVVFKYYNISMVLNSIFNSTPTLCVTFKFPHKILILEFKVSYDDGNTKRLIFEPLFKALNLLSANNECKDLQSCNPDCTVFKS